MLYKWASVPHNLESLRDQAGDEGQEEATFSFWLMFPSVSPVIQVTAGPALIPAKVLTGAAHLSSAHNPVPSVLGVGPEKKSHVAPLSGLILSSLGAQAWNLPLGGFLSLTQTDSCPQSPGVPGLKYLAGSDPNDHTVPSSSEVSGTPAFLVRLLSTSLCGHMVFQKHRCSHQTWPRASCGFLPPAGISPNL